MIERELMDDRKETLASLVEGENVLDVGCARSGKWQKNNWLHNMLRRSAATIQGLDYNKKVVEKLRIEGYDITYGNAESYIFDTEFSRIVVAETLGHMMCPGDFLETARKNLRPDGRLIIQCANAYSLGIQLEWAIKGYKEQYDYDQKSYYKLFHFSERGLRNLLERCGYEIERIIYTTMSSNYSLKNLLLDPLFHWKTYLADKLIMVVRDAE